MQWLNKLSIKYKILLISIISAVGFSLYLAFSYSVTNSNADRLKAIKDVYFPVLEITNANIMHLDKIKEKLSAAVSAAELEIINETDSLSAKMDASFNRISEIDPAFQLPADQLRDLLSIYYDNAKRLTEGMISGKLSAEEVKPAADKMIASLKTFEEALTIFRLSSYNKFTTTIHDANEASQHALTFGLAIGMIVVIIIGITAFIMSSLISSNINNVVRSLKDMASGQGDLRKRLASKGSDEIGELVHWFNVFVERLQGIIRNVIASTNTIAVASTEIAKGNNDLSTRTATQAVSLEETAASMEEMSATIKQNADNADHANQTAEVAREQAIKGSRVASSAVAAMHDISESSHKISDIISVIDGIAFQTNLLSLNAAVEAARAEEHGRGFAVVAAEVRSLALRSATAAKEIKDLINDSVNKVKAGSDLVEETGKTLEQIVNAVNKVLDIVSSIAAANQQQYSGVEQVNQAVIHIDKITQQNAALVEEAAAVSLSMEQQARVLLELMRFFKVDADGPMNVLVEEKRFKQAGLNFGVKRSGAANS